MGTDALSRLEKRPWGLALSVTVIFSSLYMGTASFSIGGLIGFALLNIVLLLVLENLLKSEFGLAIGKPVAAILASLGIVTGICIKINRELIDNAVAILVIAFFMVTLVTVCFAKKASSKQTKLLVFLVSAGLILCTAFIVFSVGTFTPDSYSYYDIACTTFKDYGNTGIIRQYVVDSEYNCSFPYLFPFFIWLVDRLTGLGIYSGILVDFYLLLFSIVLINMIGKRLTSSYVSGAIASFILLTSPYMLDETCTARSIPMAFFFVLTAFFLFVLYFKDGNGKARFPLLIGASLGLAMCTRFDDISAVAYCAAVFLLLPGKRIRNFLLYVLGGGLAALPWMIYSLIRFGKVWATDNGGTLFLVEPAPPTRIILEGSNAPTLYTAPSLWFASLFKKAGSILSNVSSCSLASNLIFLVGVATCIWIIAKKKPSKKAVVALIAVVLFYALKTCMYILVGYPDERYHAETMIVVPFALLVFIALNKVDLRTVLTSVSCLVLSVATLVMYYFVIPTNFPNMVFPTNKENTKILSDIAVTRKFLLPCLERMKGPDIPQDKAILVIRYSYEYAIWSDTKVYAEPTSCDEDTIEYLIGKHPDIGFVLVPGSKMEEFSWMVGKYPGEQVGFCTLFRVNEKT